MNVLDRTSSHHYPIRNFLVKALYQIEDRPDLKIKPPANSWDHYQSMHDLSLHSFCINLAKQWDLRFFTGKQPSLQHAFIDLARQIKDLWHRYWPCNILYADCDTLCVRPLDIFGSFREFRMFTSYNPVNKTQYFNGGVKYFPYTIHDDFWTEMHLGIEHWNYDEYGYEQDLFTDLFWKQPDIDINKTQSYIVQQGPWKDFDHLKDHMKKPRCILHYHSTRDPELTANLMQETWNMVSKNHDNHN